jgi:hypothetical protein
MARTAQSVREMHDWYMDDGRRSLASVAREFDMGEEEIRARFVDADLELKTAQPLRGAAAKNKAKAQQSNGEPELHAERDEHPIDELPEWRPSEPDPQTEVADILIGMQIARLDAEIERLSAARFALRQVLGEGGEDE